MHLLPVDRRSLDHEVAAIDVDRSPADLVYLSFSDGDLAVAAEAWERDRAALPSLRLVNLAHLRHPFSVDLFVAKTLDRARFVLVRLLGGLDYWRYGVEEIAAAARRLGFALAVVPGDGAAPERLDEASTVSASTSRRLRACLDAGGADNVRQALRLMANHGGATLTVAEPRPLPPAGLYRPGCRSAPAAAPHALILFYRSALLAADLQPIERLADALAARGARVSAFAVASLKDEASAATLGRWMADHPLDVILNTTAFSAQRPEGCVTDAADAPVLQVVLAGAERDVWSADLRGLGAADLAMNVVMPEFDGRLMAGVASFKAEIAAHPALEFSRVAHRADPERIARIADRALAWAALRRRPRDERRLACILSDYPGRGGRAGQAVGLDAPASVAALSAHLRAAGFGCSPVADPAALMAALTQGPPQPCLPLEGYAAALADLPAAFVASVTAAWGEPADDPDCRDGGFGWRLHEAGKLVVAVQPDRGRRTDRRADYHDATLPPRHGYVAFYLWLRQVVCVDAIIHLGTHGTLEWLPGKAVALGAGCAPDVLLGSTPVIYPFIVSNPGEAAQAKRRLGAVTLGHLPPPLTVAGLQGDTADLERLFDEYAEAATLDPRRARLLATTILDTARASGFRAVLDAPADAGPDTVLAALDAWLCDLKEARIGDGLHVFGHAPDGAAPAVAACGPAELDAVVSALDGRFVRPGPSGTPWCGRGDVLPTGRNMFAIDPRAIPTRTAWDLGARMAEDLVTRYAQDYGEWPRRVVLDLWGSTTTRTGGQDLAQALALIGTRPLWDDASTRVTGYEILPLARLGRSRVDTTLRISGLFRDTFPEQITLFDAAVRAVAALDEADEDNPIAASRRADGEPIRIYGSAPATYGAGLGAALTDDRWQTRDELGALYLATTTHSYGRAGTARPDPAGFAARVGSADAFSHTGDLSGQDVLESDLFAEHEGGFAAAAASLGAAPASYRADVADPARPRLRTLAEEIERALVSRAAHPRWIAGQMRHGYAGAAAMADTLDALFGFAATTDAVPSRHFDRFFDATFGDDAVHAFLIASNPAAAAAMAARFRAAIRRGLWHCRRNSTLALLADAQAALP